MKKLLLSLAMMALPMTSVALEGGEGSWLDEHVGPRIAQCQEHFDITPYLIVAMGIEEHELIDENVAQAIDTFSKTGRLPVTVQGQIAQSCATFAEGMLVGGVYRSIVAGLIEALEGLGADVDLFTFEAE